MKTKRELIKSIHVNEANFDFIRDKKTINGTLLVEIERILDEYAKIKCEEQRKICSDYLQKQESGIVGNINYFDNVDFPEFA